MRTLTRKALLCSAVIGLGVWSLADASPVAAKQIASSRPEATAGTRSTIDLSKGWRFRYGADVPEAVSTPGFDDASWETVDVPHNWNRVGAYSLTRPTGTDNRQGIAWYRLTISAPAAAGQRRYLDFAAVGNIADVWVNGIHVGQHRGAYTRFRFDVTAQWKDGQRNVVAVRADNSKPAQGSTTGDVLPLAGDFFIYGGIYRGVSLVTTDPVGFDLLDYGGPGVYARATRVTPDAAEITVLSRLRNADARARRLSAVTTIADADGRVVARGATTASLAKGRTGESTQTLRIPRPHLWNGRADPYRYTVSVALMDGRRLIDRVSQPLGVRTFRFDAAQGLLLNGSHLALHGVARHQDWLGKGAALMPADQAADMAMIADIGANTVRGAHYPHNDAWYELADRYGMVMWAEVPYISASSFDGTDGAPATFANGKQQLIELIRQQYNHPSILMWSTGNEVDASMLYLKTDRPARGLALLQALTDTAKAEDPTRPTTFADCCEDSPFSRGDQQKLAGVTELSGYNRYYGWYYGAPKDEGPALDRLHAKHPQTPMSVTEYGAGGALSQHTDNPQGGPIASFGRPHPEEYQSWYHEETWKGLKARPYLYGTWVWNMFDFASDLREEGDAIDINDKGLVTFDRKNKKDAFYFYQANWSATPMVHLTGKRYVDRAYPVVDVKAYSNADKVALSLNGKPVGEIACPDRICVWPSVRLAPGANTLRVSASVGGKTIEDSLRWNAPDAAQGLSIDSGTLTGHVAGDGHRYGSDNFFDGGNGNTLTPALPGARAGSGKVVSGTADTVLFDTYRSGSFRYVLPVPDGRWTLVIHTFEPSKVLADDRTFAVKVDGATVLDQFNPAKAAGGVLKAVTRTFPITVKGGSTTVEFIKQGGSAVVAGLELRR